MNKLSQVSSKSTAKAKVSAKAKVHAKLRAGAKSKVKAKARVQAPQQIWPLTLPNGATWNEEGLTARDFEYQAYCRCVTPDYTEGISICNTGCGNPDTVCNTDFGCTIEESSCDKTQCTCKPDGIDTNYMTYQQCVDQCAAVGMILPDRAEALPVVKGTGCDINSKEMWSMTDGAVELPDPQIDCTNDDTITDSWGDSCSDWYDQRPETCGMYDTDDFVASDACCSCKYTDLSTWADLEGYVFDPMNAPAVLEDHFAVIFTKDNCEYCQESINFLNSVGYPSLIIDFDRMQNGDEAAEYVASYIGNTMVPAIFIRDGYIGGYTQLVNMWNAEAPDDLYTAYHEWNLDQIECYNDDTVSDSWGDTCSQWYTGDNLQYCGDFDTDEFIAAEACCECM